MWESRISRLFNILSYLSPHSQVTIHDLAAEYEVDEKTISRDIEILQSAQLGIFKDEDRLKIHRNGYRKIKSWIIS